MDEEQLKARAHTAAKKRFDDLLELEEILLSGESLKDVLFQGLTTAFEVGFVAGHVAGRADACVAVEVLAEAMMSEFEIARKT